MSEEATSSNSSNGSSRFEIVGDEEIAAGGGDAKQNNNAVQQNGSESNEVLPPPTPATGSTSKVGTPSKPAAAPSNNAHPPVISNDVAFVKMEQKLKRAMSQIAELSAEKEMLEHLNIQLQEETDTVGESRIK